MNIVSPTSLSKDKLPRIALVGRPNVGKSTLFNRLTKTRKALVAPIPGTTRDRKEGVGQFPGFRFQIVDTGGLMFGEGAFSKEIEDQISAAVIDSDIIWFVLDAKEGLNPYDQEMHRWLLKTGKPILVMVNKSDNTSNIIYDRAFYGLGKSELLLISATHGTGLERVLEKTSEILPGINAPMGAEIEDTEIKTRIAFLGRPNVGKSSLVNLVLNDNRMIVSPVAGTTRESVELPLQIFGREYLLVDTAGIRKRAKTKAYLDKISALNSLGVLNHIDVAVLVLDASEDFGVQDSKIGSEILEQHRAVVIVLNKWDKLGGNKKIEKEVMENLEDRLRFISFAAVVKTSATKGSGMEQLFKEINQASDQFGRKILTSDVNRAIESAVVRFPPPAKGRSQTKIYYGLQTGTRPPKFNFFTNHVDSIDDAYTRFFENQLRFMFGLKGTPVKIFWKNKNEKRVDTPQRKTRHKKSP